MTRPKRDGRGGQWEMHAAHVIKTCAVDGCDRTDVKARGWCAAHYHRWLRRGDVAPDVPLYAMPSPGRLDDRARRRP